MGVYIHIPFCARKCYYCDFYSIVINDESKRERVMEEYIKAVCQEASLYASQMDGNKLKSIFLGGGTPSLLPLGQLEKLLSFVLKELPFVTKPEITLEINPHSVTEETAVRLGEAGVNRISLGAQAFQADLLKTLGRQHSVLEIRKSVEILQNAGFSNLSLDLMYGLPNQTMEDWLETLEEATALMPAHLSCYSLIIEEGTPYARWLEKGLLELPSADLTAEMYGQTRSFLNKAGFEHYEIANFARPGYFSQHNLLYWKNLPFLGLGTAATGYWQNCRYTNFADVGKYLASLSNNELPIAVSEQVSLDQKMDETMMVGMRLLAGVNELEFKERYGQSFFTVYNREIQSLLQRGLVEFQDGFLRVTEQGLFLENMVSAAFLR